LFDSVGGLLAGTHRYSPTCNRGRSALSGPSATKILLTVRKPPFAGKPRALAESQVRPLGGVRYSRFVSSSHEVNCEINMNTSLTKRLTMNNILGTALLLFGSALSYLRVETATEHVTNTLQSYGLDVFGLLPAVGLASARLLQDLTLSHGSALAMLLGFLLSCWPVAVSLLGAVLLRDSLFPSQSENAYAANNYDSPTFGERR
jgi:hypothetical protein